MRSKTAHEHIGLGAISSARASGTPKLFAGSYFFPLARD